MSDKRFIYEESGDGIGEMVVHDTENFTTVATENMDRGLNSIHLGDPGDRLRRLKGSRPP